MSEKEVCASLRVGGGGFAGEGESNSDNFYNFKFHSCEL